MPDTRCPTCGFKGGNGYIEVGINHTDVDCPECTEVKEVVVAAEKVDVPPGCRVLFITNELYDQLADGWSDPVQLHASWGTESVVLEARKPKTPSMAHQLYDRIYSLAVRIHCYRYGERP